jgi:uncharacterized protein YggU (UPF0235/DUF167 family)
MLIKVRVKAGARNESLKKVADRYDISVREEAEGGMANARVLSLLARELGIIPKRLLIIKGQRSPSKTIRVRE